MFLGTVRGQIFSTINHPYFDGHRLLIVDRTDERGEATGGYVIAVDTVGAGPGQPVLVLDEGTGARQILGDPSGPVRSVIVGIVDHVETTA